MQQLAKPANEHRYLTLDALRGLAALTIVQFHTFNFFGKVYFPHAHLGVDFFFLLSGFVITVAYQKKLDTTWSTGAFLKVRFIRLYPMYFLGLLLGALIALIVDVHTNHRMSMSLLATFFAMGILVFPNFWFLPLPTGRIYPLDFPAWTLFGETLANILHTLFLRRRSMRFMVILAIISGLAEIASIIHFRTIDVGVQRHDVFLILPRVTFPYVLGSILYRRFPNGLPGPRIDPFFCGAALVGILMVPTFVGHDAWYDFFIAFFIWPILLLVSAKAIVTPALGHVFKLLGAISYTLYVLHIPLERCYEFLWPRLFHGEPAQFTPWAGILFITLAVIASVLADKFYDIPVRDYLRKRFQPSASPPPPLY
jgi:peptidoglycan/LPS O-acetylase OafA/YrhL